MDISSEKMLRLKDSVIDASGHPWVPLAALEHTEKSFCDGAANTLLSAGGQILGSGIFDRRNPAAAWRRFSLAEGVDFNQNYIIDAMQEALARRGGESCQRLIS